jgi:hypothetical protein
MIGGWDGAIRLKGLRRFGIAITVLNILGHTVLGFEQSYAQPLASLATTYAMELFLEWSEARSHGRTPRFLLGGVRGFIDFLLPAHITGLAVAMLLYANEQIWPVVFASAVAIGQKALLRVKVNGKYRHFLNPSNFGITATLLAFPSIGIAPPYHFTEGMTGPGDWALPLVIIGTGSFVNARFTGRLPLIAAWLGGFALQAGVRSWLHATPLSVTLGPMTGVAFILYTFYMVTDPATTPQRKWAQVAFGAGVALAYGVLVAQHIVFDLFFSLTLVCTARGIGLYVLESLAQRSRAPGPSVAAATVGTPQS